MLRLFAENPQPLNIKEVEKMGPKYSVRQQVVKEVLEEVIADGLVEQDKVGTNMLYWAFQSAAGQKRRVKLQELRAKMEAVQTQITQLKKDIGAASKGKEDSEERLRLVEQHHRLEERNNTLKSQKHLLRENDPKAVREMLAEAKTVLAAANRWTDNIHSSLSFAKKKFMLPTTKIAAQSIGFEDAADIEDIDMPPSLK